MTQTFSFPEAEKEVLKYWTKHNTFETSNKIAENLPKYTFYDGPPFATGLPHYGHILASTIKDTVTRFYYQHGYSVERRFGWDCHGLPIEYEIDKRENIKDREEIIKMGIDNYNNMCRSIVELYTTEWKGVISRLGRWVSFDDGYKTMDTTFMESVWYVFSQLFQKDKIYRGYKVMPFSTACSTPVSNFEANQNYMEVDDPSIVIKITISEKIEDKEVRLLVWTTTPWTLPSNCGLVVDRTFTYCIVEADNEYLVILESRVDDYFNTDKKITKKARKDGRIVGKIKGSDLEGKTYKPIFKYFDHLSEKGFFKIIHGNFVVQDVGTGIVHCAPAFGEEDYNCFVENNLIKQNDAVPCPVDDKGCFTDEVFDFSGRYVKDCDKEIIAILKKNDILFFSSKIKHRYPFCWRSDTPLLYKLVPNWFISVKDSIDDMLENNEKINWVPKTIKYKKFHDWLKNAKDWSVSRNRFWGTPIPIWTDKDYKKFICVGSIKELEDLAGTKIFRNLSDTECTCLKNYLENCNCSPGNCLCPLKIHKDECYKQTDIHRENIDNLVIVKDGIEYRRVDEVLDCWFESGCMPYAQNHFPFSSRNINLPADFIAEGIDQTRGWFYTLHVISSMLFNKPAFQNVIVNGIVLAKDGKKMSKRLRNYPDVIEIINRYGSDSLRLTLLSSPVTVAENLKFNEERVFETVKKILVPWYNVLKFYLDSADGECGVEMDDWINFKFNKVLGYIETELHKYRLNNLINEISAFIDDLSNWYLRINRDKIRNGKSKTLKNILLKFSIIMGPFTPFFSEFSYNQLCRRDLGDINNFENETKKSVHFQMYPAPITLECSGFDSVKLLILGIRSIREAKKISLKTPLRAATVLSTQKIDVMEKYIDTILKECNVLELKHEDINSYKFKVSFKPNFSEIKGDQNSKKSKISTIRDLTNVEIEDLVKNKTLTKNGTTVSMDEVLYTKELQGHEECSRSFDEFSVLLDTKMDPELIEMREARNFYSFLQVKRKEMKLKVEDRRLVYIENQAVKNEVSKYYDIEFTDKLDNEKIDFRYVYVCDNKDYEVYLLKK